MNLLPLIVVLVPVILVAGVLAPASRRLAMAAAPWAAFPALLVAIAFPPMEPAALPWLLLGSSIGVDFVGQVFLLFTAILWTVAGVYARSYHREDPRLVPFFAAFLATMSGNLGLIVAHDAATFYTAFAVMSFSAYPLVVHSRDPGALRAGRVYIIMAVLGEAMLLAGLLLAARSAVGLGVAEMASGVAISPHRDLAVGLLIAGFGVKAGALPLHIWLPLAHPVAPTAASAVLSGCMIKAGLLGWIRFLPLGEATLPGWGALVIGFGVAAAFFGVLIGVTQSEPKTALAYSSISQMGLMNVAIGVGLARPEAWSSALAACLAYAVHHGLAKGALFLGVGVATAARPASSAARRLSLGGLAFAALAIAGAPLTAGSVAKHYLKELTPLSPAAWPQLLEWLLPLTAVGTTLLMARFLWLIAHAPASKHAHPTFAVGLWLPWSLLLACVAIVLWLLPHVYELDLDPPGLPYTGAIWASIWPIVAGAMIVWTAIFATRRLRLNPGRVQIAAGDLLLLAEWPITRLRPKLRRHAALEPVDPVVSISSRWYGLYSRGGGHGARRIERTLTEWTAAGVLAVAIALALAFLLASG